jgi:hypothetical protein
MTDGAVILLKASRAGALIGVSGGATLDHDFYVNQTARVIEIRLRHMQNEMLALSDASNSDNLPTMPSDAFERLVKQQAFGAYD